MSEPFSSIDELFCPAGGRVTFVGTDSQGKELLMAAFWRVLATAFVQVCHGNLLDWLFPVYWRSPQV